MSLLENLGFNADQLAEFARSGVLEALQGSFDAEFYLATYPDIAEAGLDPLEHYMRFGWQEGRDPSPTFSTRHYLETHPGVAAAGQNPFLHYLTEGKAAGAADVIAGPDEDDDSAIFDEMDRLRAAFDPAFYLAEYPGVAEADIDPLEHFVRFGWKEGRNPHPDFSTRFYMEANPGVAAAGQNPFLHYVTDGKREGRPGSPEAAARDSAAEAALVEEMERIRSAFDAGFYAKAYPGVVKAGFDPLDHFVRFGWKEGRNPRADFSTLGYLADNPGVATAGINPFLHHVTTPAPAEVEIEPAAGDAVGPAAGDVTEAVTEGVMPEEAAAPAATDVPDVPDAADAGTLPELTHDQREEMKALADDFDAAFYLETYPDIAATGIDPLAHFVTQGWQEGRDPNAEFSIQGYTEANSDIGNAGVNPFWHYVVAGKAEGRMLRLPEVEAEPDAEAQGTDDPKLSALIAAVRDEFDTAFYLSTYPDIAEAGIDPLLHYMQSGWQEGRDPNPEFSTQYYLDTHTDIAEAGIHPFWHFVVAGKAEGRPGRHPGGYKVDKLITQKPLEEVVLNWRGDATPETLLEAADIVAAIGGALSDGIDRLFVSIGHDNYRAISGGIQVCIQHEENLAASYGGLYLNLHPFQPLPRLAHQDEDPDVAVNLILGGEMIGTALTSEVIAATTVLRGELAGIELVVHHPLGHNPEQLADLARAADADTPRCRLWLHDFFTICPSFTLQRNAVTFCHAPDLASNACTLCLYGRERAAHQARMKAFFDALDVHVLSPSQVTADLWQARSGLNAASLQVCPHMTLDWVKRAVPLPAGSDRIVVAFLGTPAPHKGWAAYDRLVRNLKSDGRFKFVYCGSATVPNSAVSHVPVHVTAETPDAMIEAVNAEQADLVLHWASWPETFSLSTYEALAGGAYVLTNPISGNVAATVERLGRGAVLQDEADLEAFFADGRVEAMVETLRAERSAYSIRWTTSDMSMPILQQGAGQ